MQEKKQPEIFLNPSLLCKHKLKQNGYLKNSGLFQ